MREDWRTQMAQVHEELGIDMVRFHGIFDDDMSVVWSADGSVASASYSFFNIFQIYDWLVAHEMKPYVELSFMPRLLKSTNATIMWYEGNISPPEEWDPWKGLIEAFASALVDRYGIEEVETWPFEVWNEPNCAFWDGTIDQYFTLLSVTYTALKSVNPRLRVGGPASCQVGLIPETLDFCRKKGVKLDFVSTHTYPTDVRPVSREAMTAAFDKALAEAEGLPVYFSEFNDGLWCPGYHDTSYAATFVAHTAIASANRVDLASWWTFSDIFEEEGFQPQPFDKCTGWGLLNNLGIPKPVYRVFQKLHELPTTRLEVKGGHPTVGVAAVPSSTSVDLVVYNHDVPGSNLQAQNVSVVLEGMCGAFSSTATVVRIDDTHCNPLAKWKGFGSPTYPSAGQVAALLRESELVEESVDFPCSQDYTVRVVVPAEGVAFVKLQRV